ENRRESGSDDGARGAHRIAGDRLGGAGRLQERLDAAAFAQAIADSGLDQPSARLRVADFARVGDFARAGHADADALGGGVEAALVDDVEDDAGGGMRLEEVL